jgi:excinuclease UvrABC ATPase subunit
MDKPDVDVIEGLSPAISIEQKPPATTRAATPVHPADTRVRYKPIFQFESTG